MLVWDFVHMSAGDRRCCYMWLWAAYPIWQLEPEIGSCGRAARALSHHSRGHCQSLSWLSQKYFIPISIVYLSDLRILYLLLVLSLTKEWYLDSRKGSHKSFPIYSFAPLPLSTGLKLSKLDETPTMICWPTELWLVFCNLPCWRPSDLHSEFPRGLCICWLLWKACWLFASGPL